MNKNTKSIFVLSLALAGMLAAGLVTGVLAGFLSNILYIVFLFPLGMGLVAGFFVEKTIYAAKIRVAWQGALLGGLMLAAVYGAYQATDYYFFRLQAIFEFNQQMMEATGELEPMVANLLVDYALEEATGFSGYPGFLLYTAREGITVGRMFGSGINLGPFSWLFWLAELAIIGWVTIGMGKKAPARRFCEACNRWYGKEQHLGGVRDALAPDLTQLLERRDFAGAGAMLEPDAEMPSMEIYEHRCERCNSSDTWLALKWASIGGNGRLQFSPGPEMCIRPHERAGLLGALNLTTETTGPGV